MISEIVSRLAAAGCVAPEEEAIELLEAAGDSAALDALVTRRASGEPLAWLVGSVPFCGIQVKVHTGVYVPRWQTEPLARKAAAFLPEGGIAVDLCTGAGAIACVLHAMSPLSTVVAIPLSTRLSLASRICTASGSTL